jgi:hypothetical protein
MLEKDDGVAAAVGGSDAAESKKTATNEVSVTFTTSPSVRLLPADVTRHLLCIKATHGDVVCEHTHLASRRSACATTAV